MKNIIIIIFILLYFINKNTLYNYKNIEYFYNSPSQLGNTICSYFYDYALSICNKTDFNTNIYNYDIIKYLPTYIPFNNELYNKLNENNITIQMINSKYSMCFWHCDEEWIYNLWNILRSIIHNILNKSIIDSNLQNNIKYPIIHFRCADVPFIKHNQYYLQKYSFF
jgi:hypothetical protein